MEVVYVDVNSRQRIRKGTVLDATHNDYDILLPHTLRDVVKVDIEAAEIPMTMYAIHGPAPGSHPDSGTNKFTVKIFNDGNVIDHAGAPIPIGDGDLYFTAELLSGNYNADDVAVALQAELAYQFTNASEGSNLVGAQTVRRRLHADYVPVVVYDKIKGLLRLTVLHGAAGPTFPLANNLKITVNQYVEAQTSTTGGPTHELFGFKTRLTGNLPYITGSFTTPALAEAAFENGALDVYLFGTGCLELHNTNVIFLHIDELAETRAQGEYQSTLEAQTSVGREKMSARTVAARFQLPAGAFQMSMFRNPLYNVRSYTRNDRINQLQLIHVRWIDERGDLVDFNDVNHSFVLRVEMDHRKDKIA
jgi:hypothetical protein